MDDITNSENYLTILLKRNQKRYDTKLRKPITNDAIIHNNTIIFDIIYESCAESNYNIIYLKDFVMLL